MANRYWVGGTGNWSDNTNHWSATDGGAPGASTPTSADNANFTASSAGAAYVVTVDSAASCLDITTAAPAAGTLTLTPTAALSVYGSMSLHSGILGGTGVAIVFAATAIGKTITTNGYSTSGGWTFNGAGGGWTLNDGLTTTGAVTLTAGTLNTNGQTCNWGSYASAGTGTRVLTLGASIINVTASGGWAQSTTTNFTLNANTSSIRLATNASNFTGGGLTYYELQHTATSSTILDSGNSFTNFIKSFGSAAGSLSLSGNITVTGTLTLTGTSDLYRLVVSSNTLGTQRTITSASNSISYCDFQDIVGAGAASWNLSAITGNSGDCGNNSGITFTTPTTLYWYADTGNMSSSAKWFLGTGGTGGAGRGPLPQDTLIFDGNSFSTTGKTVTMDLARIGSMDWTSATNNPTWTQSGAVSKGFYGGMTLISGMSLTTSASTFVFSGASNSTLTTGGKTIDASLIIQRPSATITLGDDLTLAASRGITLNNGTFDTNNKNLNISTFASASGASVARTLVMGNGNTWTLFGNATTIWSTANQAGLSVTNGTAIVNLSYTGATGTRTVSQLKPGANINFSAAAATDTISFASTSVIGDLTLTSFAGTLSGGGAITINGSLLLGASLTNSFTFGITFNATATGKSITSAGKVFASAITFDGVGGGWTFTDAFSNTSSVTLTNGAVTLNGSAFSCTSFASSNSNIRSLTLSTSTVTLTGTGTVWNLATVTNLTLSAASSTIVLTNTSATAKTFAGGGKTYGNFTLTGADNVAITGANTFAAMTLNNKGVATGLILPAVTTTTITSLSGNGTAGQLVPILSSIAASAATLSCANPVSVDYFSIKDSTAAGNTPFYAGANSTNVSGNTNWLFTAPPSTGSNRLMPLSLSIGIGI